MVAFKNILFPVDFSDRCRATAPFVLSLAQRYRAHVTLLHVVEPAPLLVGGIGVPCPPDLNLSFEPEEAQWKLNAFAHYQLPKVDKSCVVEVGSPADVIGKFADRNPVDLVAIPTHGYGGFRRMLLGSVAATVLQDVKVPVWTDAHAEDPSNRSHPKPRRILVALDVQTDDVNTLQIALQMAREADASVEIVYAATEDDFLGTQSPSRLRNVLSLSRPANSRSPSTARVPKERLLFPTEKTWPDWCAMPRFVNASTLS